MSDAAPALHVLLAGGDKWRQVLVYPSPGTSADGVLLYPQLDTALWIELHNGKVWGFALCDYSTLLTYAELEHMAPLLEACQPNEYHEVCRRIGLLTGRYPPASPTQRTHEAICATLTASWLAAQMDTAPLQAWVGAATDILPHVTRALGVGLHSFHAALDAEALALAGCTLLADSDDVRRYAYFFHAAPAIQRNRRQVARVYPWEVEMAGMVDDDHGRYRLRQNIDAGNPLIPLFAEYYRVAKRVMRYMVGKDYALIGTGWHGNLDTLFNLLDLLKPERYPRSAADWESFNRWVKPLARFLDRDNGVSAMTLADWLEELLREGYPALAPRFAAHGVTLGDVEAVPDLQRALRHWATAVNPRFETAAFRRAMASYGILRLAALSRRWHTALARWMEDDSPSAAEAGAALPTWPSFIEQPWNCGALQVVPLTNLLQLRDEGQRMQHCVGTYASQCLFLGAHIFSIRDAGGCALSTAELRPHNESGVWRIREVQHRAHANDDPTPDCRATLARFIAWLDAEVPQRRYADIEWERVRRCAASDDYRDILRHYDWPPWMLREFRELLHDYPLLAKLGETSGGEDYPILTQEEVDALLRGVCGNEAPLDEAELAEVEKACAELAEEFGEADWAEALAPTQNINR